jgi:glycyl-tRNA synthetase beta chain
MSGEVFIELVCEELPAEAVRPALQALEGGLRALLEGLVAGDVRTYATPRRLAVVLDDVAESRPVTERLITGPPAERAFDAQGRPTQAGIGFARGRGLEPSALERITTPKGEVVAVRVQEGGERTVALLAAGLDGVLRGLPFQRSMEWGTGGMRFARPLHRVNALYAGQLVQGHAAGLTLGRQSLGHRLAEDTTFEFNQSQEWLAALRARKVEPDLEVRKALIRGQLAELAQSQGADPIDDEPLLEEVVHLVEWPTPLLSTFDAQLLELPPRLLVESMRVHQRYFPLHRDGALTNRFALISNNPWGDERLIAEGNARVLRARFDDARFFLAEDKKQALGAQDAQLAKMQWIRGLGTMLDKAHRVADLAAELAPLLGADPKLVRRAGHLAKSDLATAMVGEFPELQGHMGRLYALHGGEDERVALAIEEHYLPRFAGDRLPGSPEGAALALAERVDSLTGCFGIGMTPKGGGDPQGLRRAALGVVTLLAERGLRIELGRLFEQAVLHFHARALAADRDYEAWKKERGESAEHARDREALVQQLVQFVLARLQAAAVASGLSADVVDAVLAVTPPDVLLIQAKLEALRELCGSERFLPVLTTFKRVLNITRDQSEPAPARADLGHPSEQALFDALQRVEGQVTDAARALDYGTALRKALDLEAPVAALFDSVLVEDPDPALRSRRLGLLLGVSRVFLEVADFARISTR